MQRSHFLQRGLALMSAALLAAGTLATPAALAQSTEAANPTPTESTAPTQPARDGKSAATAAGSCWDIKQNYPDAPDGAYWLLTPSMEAPERFYCDQTTDGGGWVMIGRGRESWDRYPVGKGDPAALLTRDRTPASFEAVQLPAKTIDGLLDGGAVNELPQGIRVMRATDAAGAGYQSVNIRPSKMKGWTWALASEDTARVDFPETPMSFGASRMDQQLGYNSGANSLDLTMTQRHNYKMGFAYGWRQRGGSDDATSFLWSNTGYGPMPYAELYLRPQVSSTGFKALDDSGLPAVENSPVASSFASPTSWGVTGNLNGRTAEGNAPVQAFAQLGDTMFVGGNFTAAENRSTGEKVARTAVAAFDSTTGELRRDFSLDLDGQVKALLALPGGKLLVGGDFRTAGGQPHAGTVLVDPQSGAIDASWTLQVSSRLSGGDISVKALSLGGDKVYLGGKFTHLGDASVSSVYARSAGRVSVNGTPDRSWNPEFNGTVVDIDTSTDDARLYAAGYFTKSQDAAAFKAAAISTAAGAAPALDWQFVGSDARPDKNYQQAIEESGGLLFVGGSEHSLFGYETMGLQRVSGSIGRINGGDIQAIASDGTVTYAGCHCSENIYQDAYLWPNLNPDWTEVDNIQWFGAWDAKTGKQLGEFSPYMLGSNNGGAWALEIADDGAVWAGGDFTGSRTSMTASQWNGGFVRYPAVDHEAPASPTGVRVNEATASTVGLVWGAEPDAASYEILRDDRVVATTTSTRASVPRGGNDRFYVRSVDAAGNRSATTSVIQAPQAGALGYDSAVLFAAGETWEYSYNQGAPAADWAVSGGDRAGWQSGAAPLGYGGSDLATTFDAPAAAARPVAAYFAHSVDIANPRSFTSATLELVADDGAVVYVNGREVGRVRMSEGAVGFDTRANAVVSDTQARARKASIEVPWYYFSAGANEVAVETHLNYKSSPTLTFDASLVITDPTPATDAKDPLAEDKAAVLVANGADWAYSYSAMAPGEGWDSDADVSAWTTGATPIGWGGSGLGTTLSVPASERARTAYFVKDLDIDPAQFAADATVRVQVVADDGAIVRLNGEEIGRARMAAGSADHNTYAAQAVTAATAAQDPLVIEVPVSQLRSGTNRLAVETHLNYRSTPSMTFDARVDVTQSAARAETGEAAESGEAAETAESDEIAADAV